MGGVGSVEGFSVGGDERSCNSASGMGGVGSDGEDLDASLSAGVHRSKFGGSGIGLSRSPGISMAAMSARYRARSGQ